jgi:hypothetical protein
MSPSLSQLAEIRIAATKIGVLEIHGRLEMAGFFCSLEFQ